MGPHQGTLFPKKGKKKKRDGPVVFTGTKNEIDFIQGRKGEEVKPKNGEDQRERNKEDITKSLGEKGEGAESS